VDNITHTVIGLLTGDAVHNATNPRKMPSLERRRLFILSSIFGSNIADADVFLKKLLPPPLGMLLHHRGHTHTLIMAAPQALLVVAVLLLFRGTILSKKLSLKDWFMAFLMALLAVCLHILADSWNSYGIHPFYPFNNNWYFGDFIFIVEPLFWGVSGAWILLELSFFWRAFYFSIFSLVLGYGHNLGVINYNQMIILFFMVVALSLLMSLFKGTSRSLVAIFSSICFLIFFRHQSYQVDRLVTKSYNEHSMPALIDLATSPAPLNPFCWTVLAATIEKEQFVVRKASVSLWPERIKASECVIFDRARILSRGKDMQIDYYEVYRTPLASFENNFADCYLREWLRYARMPQIIGNKAVDVRFSNRGLKNFTEMEIIKGRKCLENVPPWVPPRVFLLSRSAS